MIEPLDPSRRSYVIIGNGRLAKHFAHYLGLRGIPFRQWSRSIAALSGLDPATSLRDTIRDSSHILLLIKDSEIEPFVRANSFLQSKKLLHCSGSLVTELADGYHPLFSFSHTLYDLPTYESIPIICEAGRPGFREAFPSLPNPWIAVEPSEKAYYHALCVLSGNFTTIVWQKAFKEFESRLGISQEFASLYLKSIVRNLGQYPADALTGPIARKDMATIQSNLRALKNDPFEKLYKAMLEIVGAAVEKETNT